MFVGGPLESISIAGRTFAVTADADVNTRLGGYSNEVQMNGDTTGRILKTPVACGLTGVVTAIDPDNGDHEFLQEVADNNIYVAVTVSYANGSVYSGRLTITGELESSNQSATASFDMMGPGKLVKQ